MTEAARDEGYIRIQVGTVTLHGNLLIPEQPKGLIVFAHGSGSSRHSPRNQFVASILREAGFATLLFDLLTLDEEAEDLISGKQRFDIKLLSDRLIGVTEWLHTSERTGALRPGYFGASTGAAAALMAASRLDYVGAIVSRGGRPDLAMSGLGAVKAPTLLIVGGDDYSVIDFNRKAFAVLNTIKKLVLVPGATHLFEEPGTLEKVAELAKNWFLKYLITNN